MASRTCYHCKQEVAEGEAHDCWTTTERALTSDLSEDLQEAWHRLRETAADLGEQRIYASHNSIMFARKACYCFVRPKRSFLEVCLFLGRTLKAPQIRKAMPSSKTKVAHLVQIRHRDEVEPPFTDWLKEAYALQDQQPARAAARKAVRKPGKKAAKAAAKSAPVKGRATSARKRKTL